MYLLLCDVGNSSMFCIGETYIGQWEDGQFHGQGKIQYHDRCEYIGEFEHGKRHGQGKYTLRDGQSYDGEWKDDRPSGIGKFKDHKGKVVEGDFQHRYGLRELKHQRS